MAEYHASWRSNYFQVKDKADFERWARLLEIDWAYREVGAEGAATTAGTAIGISPDPVLAIKLAKVERECDVLEDTLERLLHSLGLANIDVQRLKSILRQAPNARKAQLAERIDKLYKTAEAREKARAEKETLSGQHEATLAEAFIAIEGTLFAGVAVKIGKELWVADAELKRSRIFIGEDGIEHQPL